jgi:hypothetical protein
MAAKKDSTSAGAQNPLAVGFQQAGSQGIVPNAQKELVDSVTNAHTVSPMTVFHNIASFLSGKKNASGNRMSPTTTKDH